VTTQTEEGPGKHFGDRIRLYCQSCRADLKIDIIVEPVDEHGKSIATETSVIGTAAFVSTRFFRCGACFIKFMQSRKRTPARSDPDPAEIPVGEAWRRRSKQRADSPK
jgi:hypothetical protein